MCTICFQDEKKNKLTDFELKNGIDRVSTSKLTQHLDKHHKGILDEDRGLNNIRDRNEKITTKFTPVKKLNIADSRILFIANHNLPISIAESPFYRNHCKAMYEQVVHVSVKQVKKDIEQKASQIQMCMKRLLIDEYVAITSDCWTAGM